MQLIIAIASFGLALVMLYWAIYTSIQISRARKLIADSVYHEWIEDRELLDLLKVCGASVSLVALHALMREKTTEIESQDIRRTEDGRLMKIRRFRRRRNVPEGCETEQRSVF